MATVTDRDDLAALDAWGFAFPGPLRGELTALALAGIKTTTAGLFAEQQADGDELSAPGRREVLLDSDERPVAVIETVDCRVVRLADVGARLGPDFVIEDDTLVVLQRFRLVELLEPS